MKTILILTYYFPPGNLTPAERVYSYAKKMMEDGYKVIVVTRNWNIPKEKMVYRYMSAGNEVEVDSSLGFEVHYAPYKSTLANKLFLKYTGHRLYFIYKIFALIFNLLEGITSKFTGLLPIYNQANAIMKDQKVDLIIASGSPFHLFKFAHNLSKTFRVPWVADYRDDWTTNDLVNQGKIKKLVRLVQRPLETKWLSNATFFVSVSSHYVDKIKSLVRIPGSVIENGFITKMFPLKSLELFEEFTICYVGSLYPVQDIEPFLQTYIQFLNNGVHKKTKMIFVGLAADYHGLNRVKQIIAGYEQYFDFTDRLEKSNAIEIQKQSHLLFHCNYRGLKGIPGSKLYDFLGVRKPVILFPSDHDILESTLSKTQQGLFPKNENECLDTLNSLYQSWEKDELEDLVHPKEDEIIKFSREALASKFIERIKHHLKW